MNNKDRFLQATEAAERPRHRHNPLCKVRQNSCKTPHHRTGKRGKSDFSKALHRRIREERAILHSGFIFSHTALSFIKRCIDTISAIIQKRTPTDMPHKTAIP